MYELLLTNNRRPESKERQHEPIERRVSVLGHKRVTLSKEENVQDDQEVSNELNVGRVFKNRGDRPVL